MITGVKFHSNNINTHTSTMLIHPSILISLFLVAKVASGTTLAPYFSKRIAGCEDDADMMLKPYQGFWPINAGTLTTKALRKSLEAGEKDKVAAVLGKLHGELGGVLAVTLYPSCTPIMKDTLLKMAVNFDGTQVTSLYKNILVHQLWKNTRDMLAALNAPNNRVFAPAAALLVFEAFVSKRFNLLGKIVGAFDKESLAKQITPILYLATPSQETHELAKIFIMNDTSKQLIPGIFKLLKTKTPTPRDFAKAFKHPVVDSQQFAQIINASLSNKILKQGTLRTLITFTSNSDIPELRRTIKSEESQRVLLDFLGMKEFRDLDLAWSGLKLKEETRHREWLEKHAKLVFIHLKQVHNTTLLPDLVYQLISEYATSTETTSTTV